MIKLLLVSPQTEQSKGGIAVWTDSYLENCNRYNIDCDLLNIATIGDRAKQGNAKRNFKDEFFRTKAIFKNLKAMLNECSYDVAHINTSCGTFGLIRDYLTMCRIKKKQSDCKTVLHIHCDAQVQCSSKISKIFLKRIIKKSDRIFVLNQNNYNYIYENYGFSCDVIPNFINNSVIRSDEKNISSEITEAVFVGYVRPQKGIRELYTLAEKFPAINFRLIGEIHDEVMSWNKPDNVVFCGKKNRSDIIKAFDNGDIFVFLSHTEGFSLALLESMSRGLPSIATKVGANEEMLEGLGGILVDVNDVDAMEQALIKLQNAQLRKDMSAWCIQKVIGCYTIDVVMEQIRCLYESEIGAF